MNDGTGAKDAGHVRVFQLDQSVQDWVQVGADLDGSQAGDWFGLSVSLDHHGKYLAVGAPGDNNNFMPGKSIVYELRNGNWTQLGSNLLGGYAVDLSFDGSHVVTGSHRGFNQGVNSGHAIVYIYNGTDWEKVGSDINGLEGEMSGSAVAISGDGKRVVSSSPAADGNNMTSVGRVHVYDFC